MREPVVRGPSRRAPLGSPEPAARASGRLTLGGVVLLALPSLGCGERFGGPPDLVTVHRVEPGSVSAGDRLVVTGQGFPQGRTAAVTFRGTLHRPGLRPELDVRIDAAAEPAGLNALTVQLDPELERRFTGGGSRAAHATFQGEVRVRFPSAPGGADVTGGLGATRLDVLPRAGQPSLAEQQAARRTLAFLGLSAERRQEGLGLAITEVSPEGRGAAAGIVPGDAIVELGGVTVLGETDLRVPSGTSSTEITVERGSRRLPALVVDVAGLAPRGITELGGPAALLLVACLLVVLPLTRIGLVLRWLALLPGLQPFSGKRWSRAGLPSRLGFLAPTPPEEPGLAVLSALTAVVVVGAAGWLSLGHSLAGPDIDLLVLPLGTSVALMAARFVVALRGPSNRLSVSRGLAAALSSALCVAPVLVAVSGAILASGRFVVHEIVADQGGAPWRWAGFRSPGLFVLMVTLVAAALPEGARAQPEAGVRGAPPGLRASLPRAFLLLSEWAHLWMTAALAVILFLGGPRVPGVTSLAQELSPLLTALGLGGFVAKVALLALCIGALRRMVGGFTPDQMAPLIVRHVAPLSVVGLVVTVLFAGALDGADTPMIADLAGTTLALLAFLVLSGMALVLGRRGEAATATVNPWL